ncbi:chemotaxis protein CheC [Candidatus Magnetomoraceae bacterium gMMP-1]
MILTEDQRDALAEIINIGFGHSASSLSDLTGQRVNLEMPDVEAYSMKSIKQKYPELTKEEIITVHQVFSGVLQGDAILIFTQKNAVTLTNLLCYDKVPAKHLNISDREVITEVGNILLNACLAIFGDMLKVHISFSVPRLHLESLNMLLDSLMVNQQELRYSVVALTQFHLGKSKINGYLLLVLSASSLKNLIQGIEKLLKI